MGILDRKNVKKISDNYKEVLDREKHHNHELVMVNGVIRWKENENLRSIDINKVIEIFYELGYDKNSEVYRKFYRDLGYSLSGYWEVFYWEVNNEDQNEYRPSLVSKIKNFIKKYFIYCRKTAKK
jgi:hypothetical protein